ncbi:MAG: ankyrin repeat domain-containing protein, partial [Planctomycetota bacterium]|nr:ankyrin repeat domain-containing protein [Planctomycetota bacterium]
PPPSLHELLYRQRIQRGRSARRRLEEAGGPKDVAIAAFIGILMLLLARVNIEPFRPFLIPEGLWPTVVKLWAPAFYIFAGFFFLGAIGAALPAKEPEKKPAGPGAAPGRSGAASAQAAAPAEQSLEEQVLDELARRETRTASWLRSLGILIISIVAFFALGILRFDLTLLALFAVIILVHEAGHMLAMLALGYRNVRMLLIPLFGGAASGEKARAPGWQLAVVALAGPVPSLLLGYILLLIAVHSETPALHTAAWLCIAINALNLLPIFPLDGGHFFNAVLFCRHQYLESGFRILTASAIILLGLVSWDWIIAGFGGLVLFGAIASRRLDALAADLRERISDESLRGQERIPRPLALHILGAVRKVESAEQSSTLADAVEYIWRRVNARPPRAPATFGLLALYGAALGSAVLVPLVVVALMLRGDLPLPSKGPVPLFAVGYFDGYAEHGGLHWSAEQCRPELTRLYLDLEEPVDLRDTNGVTPLMRAAAAGCAPCVTMLIDAGADVNAADADGRTPLLWAAFNADADTVQTLLDAGADPTAPGGSIAWLLEAVRQRPDGDPEKARILELLDACTDDSSPLGSSP